MIAERPRTLEVIAYKTSAYALERGIEGTVAVGVATLLVDGSISLVISARASKLVRTKLRDGADQGVDYGAVASAKLMRRARVELGIDDNPMVRFGEVSYRGDAAFKIGQKVYVVTFSGSTEDVDGQLALDGALAFWLALHPKKRKK